MATHSSILAWKIPWTEEPGRLQSMGSWRVGHDWVTSLSLFTFIHWRRKWLAWRIPGTGERGGLPSMGSHRVGHDWSDLAAAAANLLCFNFLLHPKSSWTMNAINIFLNTLAMSDKAYLEPTFVQQNNYWSANYLILLLQIHGRCLNKQYFFVIEDFENLEI